MEEKIPKICIVTTTGLALYKLFPDFFPGLIEKGYKVIGVCHEDEYVDDVERQGVQMMFVPMSRGFTPLRDLKCFFLMYRIFRREKFNIIHYSTPKASFLSAIAGKLAGCPAMLYTLRGLGYTAFSGIKQEVAKFCEKISCRLASEVVAISQSLKEYTIEEGLIHEDKISVFGSGSSKGVNFDYFCITERTQQEALKIKNRLGLSDLNVILGYVGRLSLEKGISELVEAFEKIKNQKICLLLIGNHDGRNPLPESLIEKISGHPRIYLLDFKKDINVYFYVMDIFILPSWREGFGNVLIEASAMEKPVIATDIPGCRSAVVNNKTGLLVNLKDTASLQKALEYLIDNPSERRRLGKNGRKWVVENFDRSLVWRSLISAYERMLGF